MFHILKILFINLYFSVLEGYTNQLRKVFFKKYFLKWMLQNSFYCTCSKRKIVPILSRIYTFLLKVYKNYA